MLTSTATLEITPSSDKDKSSDNNYNGGCYTNPFFTEDLKPCFVSNMIPRVTLDTDKKKIPTNKTETRVSINANSKETKNYDPHDFCTSKKPVNFFDTLVHLLKAAIGTGILAVPFAFKDSGYVVGVIGVFLMALFATYCVHMLMAVEYEICKRRRIPNMTYAETVEAAFQEGPRSLRWLSGVGRFMANFLFMIYESGGCAVYIIFIASNLKHLVDYYLNTDIELQVLMVYVTIPIIMCCWIRNLKYLAPLSAIANFFIIISFAIVFWYVFQKPPSFENRQATGEIKKLPIYLTTVLFSVAATGLMLPLKNEMKKPKYFTAPMGILNVALIPVCLLYSTFGLFGYLRFGDETKGSITLNLPKDELLAQIIKGLYSLSVFISYHLCYYVVYDIVWKNFLKDKIHNRALFWEYVIRTLIPLITLFMACAIPNLDLFISLVGALGISTTTLILPIFIHTLVFWDYYKCKTKIFLFLLKNVFLLAISTIIFVTGVTESVTDIIEMYYS